ncbi:hypothetical protein IP90_02717 [Luteimonas cucumeris]|uniref:Uncharacterized protein n=1 Tax=Luteimonas cucumeris TaxID=985012 RepID=A0A562L0D3_9GAMM|nr:hypothetical protein IP90_02717 [Luteimonas cucumeris]
MRGCPGTARSRAQQAQRNAPDDYPEIAHTAHYACSQCALRELPPKVIAPIIGSGGFEAPVQFYQTGFIHAWFFRRASGNAG